MCWYILKPCNSDEPMAKLPKHTQRVSIHQSMCGDYVTGLCDVVCPWAALAHSPTLHCTDLDPMHTSCGCTLYVQVSDFGLSRAMQSNQSHLSTRTTGTVTHMPPELLRDGKLCPAGDVYAFGIMSECHTLCLGRRVVGRLPVTKSMTRFHFGCKPYLLE